MARYSEAYINLLEQGPFVGQTDPWAEAGRYFQQLHSSLIEQFISQVRRPLLQMGYLVGKETSLQITERREPHFHIQDRQDPPRTVQSWDYSAAAALLEAEVGIVLDGDMPELESIVIRKRVTTQLVTVVEIISPSNKRAFSQIEEYQMRRDHLLSHGVNIAELDLTRSIKRTMMHPLLELYAYSMMVFLPTELPRLIGMGYGEPLKRCMLPLRGEGIVLDVQAAYTFAYQQTSLAAQMEAEGHYTLESLPYPTLLTPKQSTAAITTVQQWRDLLIRLETATE